MLRTEELLATKADLVNGKVPSNQLPTSMGGGADVKSGIVTLSAGGTTSVTFNTVFSSTPQVIVTAQFNNADSSCTYSTYNITANGFSIRGAGNPAGTVGWMATNGGNP